MISSTVNPIALIASKSARFFVPIIPSGHRLWVSTRSKQLIEAIAVQLVILIMHEVGNSCLGY